MCMEINKCGEILREDEAKNCGLRMLSKKERYELLYKQLSDVKQELQEANTEETVNLALDNLVDLVIVKLSKDSQVDDVRSWIADIGGTIHGVQLHDVTRSDLVRLIQKVLESVEGIIAEETKKENARKLESLLLQLAEHSDQISDIIDINKILG